MAGVCHELHCIPRNDAVVIRWSLCGIPKVQIKSKNRKNAL
ncbi:hypothetical protein [Helicobacter sp. MIT 05-5294]|nr:hypothetical protein [Helicobacter sp. MIT 05-5294]